MKTKLRLIIDSNIVFAALIRDSITRELIFHPELKILAPERLRFEVQKYSALLQRKSELASNDLGHLIHLVMSQITTVPWSLIKPCLHESKELMDHIDPDDTIYIASALCVENDGIWTEDKDFGLQDVVRIWKTMNVINEIF